MAALDPEALMQKILADPNTAKIAASLGVPVEEYAQTVLDYAMNPGKEPDVVMISDENLRNVVGVEPPSREAMVAYVEQTVKIKTMRVRSEFERPSKKGVALTAESPAAPELEGDPSLSADVGKHRRGGGNA